MSRKNFLEPFRLVDAQPMAASIVSQATNIKHLDNVGIEAHVDSGNPTGTLSVEVSASHVENTSGDVQTDGHWTTVLSAAVVAGQPETTIFDLNQLSAPWVRLRWASTTALVQTITAVADVAASLNGKYFLITDGEGALFAVWIDVDNTGVAPTVPGATLVEVDIAEDDSASTVATAVAAALDAVTASFNAAAVGAVITSTNVEVGESAPAEDVDTDFSFEVTAGDGTLSALIVAKML